MGSGLDGVKKERQAISARINELSEKIKSSKAEIQVLEDELKIVTEKRDKTYSNIQEIRKQRDVTVFELPVILFHETVLCISTILEHFL